MFVIGTAGHVDHGKSTLVQALTGINPDRLREEQEREMTIDLGFAWVTLPSGRDVSVVDVPGHEDFIKNMLAGVGGIDLALFVVAADEGVMPQTREHLAIIDLLEIPRGVVALTKSDLAEDDEWLELVQEDVRDALAGTVLADAPMVPVSATTGAGLDDLMAALDAELDRAEDRIDEGRARLPIDRIFTISGFGTVVTGTLLSGAFAVGDEVAIEPGALTARVRGLETHKTKVTEAEPGSRLAMNLSGVAVADLYRGQVVTRPGLLEPTTLLDARLRVVPDFPWPLKHNTLVDLYSGSARVQAHVRLLDATTLQPGETGWVQLRLADPVAVTRGDRYILRLASPSMTLGGGEIVQTRPGRRHRRHHQETIDRLEELGSGEPERILAALLGAQGILALEELSLLGGLPAAVIDATLQALVHEGRVKVLSADGSLSPSAGVISADGWQRVEGRMLAALDEYHRMHPLRRGMGREELAGRSRVARRFWPEVLRRAVSEGAVLMDGTVVRAPGHQVQLTPAHEASIRSVLNAFARDPGSPPTLAQVESELGEELLQVLIADGRLIKVSDEVLFDAQSYRAMREKLIAYLESQGQASVAQVRDLLGSSRRYTLSFLEDMDRQRVTKRMGDVRVLRDARGSRESRSEDA